MSFIAQDFEKLDIITVLEGRTQAVIRDHFLKYDRAVRCRVKIITMDMFSPYYDLARQLFPCAKIVFNNSLAGSSLGFCGTNFPSIALWRILALSCSGVIICPPTTAKYQLIHYQSYDLKLLFPLDNSESTQRDLRFPLPLLESHTGLNYNSTQPIH
ncbi:transposase [Streptococcus pneumoniae]|nr:transposase [Streptococcus pneumoniae]